MSNELTKLYRERCFDHHGKSCAICDNGNNLHVHHIDGDKLNNDPDNLMALCASHHRSLETGWLNKEELEAVRRRLPKEQVDMIEKRIGAQDATNGSVSLTNPDVHRTDVPVDDRGRVVVGKAYSGKNVTVVVEVEE